MYLSPRLCLKVESDDVRLEALHSGILRGSTCSAETV